jgi:hypothetical protein
MQVSRTGCWLITTLTLAGLALAACAQPIEEGVLSGQAPPARVEPIEGTDLKQVTLIPRAAERLGIKTTAVRAVVAGAGPRTVVPYAALLYDKQGDTWVYTNPEGLVFIRYAITVEEIRNDLAILTDGPPAGTSVVTVGAAELYGVESGVGGE